MTDSPLEVRVLVYNIREWNIPELNEKHDIAEHILGIPGTPVGSTIGVRDYELTKMFWMGLPVYEATPTRYDEEKS